jgi:hypothetical protein
MPVSKKGRVQNRARDARKPAGGVTAQPDRSGQRAGRSREGLSADPEVDRSGSVDALARQVQNIARMSRGRDLLAVKARRAGATWTEIAGALGVTPQAAQQRYGDGVSSSD